MSREKQIEEMARFIVENTDLSVFDIAENIAQELYNAGYCKQSDEEIIDKIATYFEKEDNWTKLKCAWNICGKSVQLRDMLRDAICGVKMKGGAE